MTAIFYVGDAIEVMGKLPENSVDLILSSPPFLALRSYLPADHESKALEGGSQATPGEYVDWLLDVVEACARVLAPHGSLCFELGDTFAGSGGAGGDYSEGHFRDGQEVYTGSEARERKTGKFTNEQYGGVNPIPSRRPNVIPQKGNGWPLAKSLSLIPESFRWAMVYGHNPFTGRKTEPWRLRNVIRWVRPNPPVGALGDKFRPATSELMVFCKAKDRYFDLDAVREATGRDDLGGLRKGTPDGSGTDRRRALDGALANMTGSNPAGAPPLDWWEVSLLDDEAKPYGPKGRQTTPETGDPKREAERDAGVGGNGWLMDRTFHQRGGSPPLDWWNIPLLEGEEPTRMAPKGPDPLRAGNTRNKYNAVRAESGLSSLSPSDGSVNPLGAPPLDWWNIPPGGYEGAHYAVFPKELLVKPIKAMSPTFVCTECGLALASVYDKAGSNGAQSLRGMRAGDSAEVGEVAGGREESAVLLGVMPEPPHRSESDLNQGVGSQSEGLHPDSGASTSDGEPRGLRHAASASDGGGNRPAAGTGRGGSSQERGEGRQPLGELGTPDEGGPRPPAQTRSETPRLPSLRRADPNATECPACGGVLRLGRVLDPFAGSGTTLSVATGHGRDAIGIDLDERNFDLALQRVGPLMLTRGDLTV